MYLGHVKVTFVWILVVAIALIPSTVGAGPGNAAPKRPLIVLREGEDGYINEWSGPAKFVLYSDGTVITERTDEVSSDVEPDYRVAHVSDGQMNSLIESLKLSEMPSEGSRVFGGGEGKTWQLIYWVNEKKKVITVVESLRNAPTHVREVIQKLDEYPKNGPRFLGYPYILTFSCAPRTRSIKWPFPKKELHLPTVLYTGCVSPDTPIIVSIDSIYARKLLTAMEKEGARSVIINGHEWRVRASPLPKLPLDETWVSSRF